MKRTLLTATAAIAFAATPATAQLVGGDAGVTTDTDIATNIGETAAETDTQVRSDVQAGVENTKDAASEWDSETEANAGVNADAGASLEGGADIDARTMRENGEGGPYTESRADATARYGDLNTMADGEISAKVDSLDTDELNAYAVGQVKKATGDASVDASSSLETEAETRY